jgi:hypothetical protein
MSKQFETNLGATQWIASVRQWDFPVSVLKYNPQPGLQHWNGLSSWESLYTSSHEAAMPAPSCLVAKCCTRSSLEAKSSWQVVQGCGLYRQVRIWTGRWNRNSTVWLTKSYRIQFQKDWCCHSTIPNIWPTCFNHFKKSLMQRQRFEIYIFLQENILRHDYEPAGACEKDSISKKSIASHWLVKYQQK